MGLIPILILAVVQGLTEFLPVSSSGHLVVGNALLESLGYPKVPDMLEVSVTLHVGTLVSVLYYYRREIWQLLTEHRRLIPLILLGSVPAGVIGIWVKKFMDPATADMVQNGVLLTGCLFFVTAAVLVLASRGARETTDYPGMSIGQALGIGVAQAIAILPGISRSGSTIAAGLGVGLRRESAGTFSFLLGIPAIAGAALLEIKEAYDHGGSGTPVANLAIGAAVSFAVGLVALNLLVWFVRSGRLSVFAWYLVPLGTAVVAWQLGFLGPAASP